MNDKDRELVERVVGAVGQAGKQGFESLVRYQVTDGILSAITYAIALVGLIWIFRRLLAWRPKDNWDDDMKHFARGLAFVASAVAIFGMLCGLETSIVQALQPEGAVLMAALHRG